MCCTFTIFDFCIEWPVWDRWVLIGRVEDSSHAGVAICRSLRSFVLADDGD